MAQDMDKAFTQFMAAQEQKLKFNTRLKVKKYKNMKVLTRILLQAIKTENITKLDQCLDLMNLEHFPDQFSSDGWVWHMRVEDIRKYFFGQNSGIKRLNINADLEALFVPMQKEMSLTEYVEMNVLIAISN